MITTKKDVPNIAMKSRDTINLSLIDSNKYSAICVVGNKYM